jgi:hypothetical protein
MALSSCALQVLGFSLPSLVICYRADRPPQVEFFAASCSCHEAACRADRQHDASGSPCLEATCTDIHLGAPAAFTAAASRFRPAAGISRHSLSPDQVATRATGLALQAAAGSGGTSQTTAPPFRARLFAGVQLRC